jgi:hypothetical protein
MSLLHEHSSASGTLEVVSMNGARKQSSLTCSLLDLPDAAINTIVTCLAAADKPMFMAACRKAFHMTMLASENELVITKRATFAGMKQVIGVLITLQLVRAS